MTPRRALAALALLFALVLAAPARGQERGAPVVGGGSFNAAPLLEPGRYHDTILPGEYLYYGFRLAAGQTLRVTVTTPDVENRTVQRMGIRFLAATLHSPSRVAKTAADVDGFTGFGVGQRAVVEVNSGEVEARDDADTGAWTGAGVTFLGLHAVIDALASDPPKAELPFTFVAEVTGAAAPNATPTPTPTPTATPRAPDGGPGPATAAVAGVGGVLIGVLLGLARRRR
ncbi:MAG TPA: hypothetical protein VNS09_12955 [Solirubrobacter sp.]|nr:hypothetical protein [Solirubrobacter sp.]